MNRTIAVASSMLLTAAITVFAASMAVGQPGLSHASSLILSFGYVGLACAFASEAVPDRRTAALIGVAFASMYSGLVTVVYFVQLTTVAQASAGSQVLEALSYSNLGSLMFNLDLLGYGLMAISTFFVGLSIQPLGTRDRVLRLLLLVHGAFAPMCFVMPMLGLFGSMAPDSGNSIGIIMLVFWCIYFAPIGLLSLAHFAGFASPRPVAIAGTA